MLLAALLCCSGYQNDVKKDTKPQGHAHLTCTHGVGKASVLQCPFHHDGRSVMKDLVVTNTVSYSNSNDSDEFPWAWNVPRDGM